jgi:hypothetical protein
MPEAAVDKHEGQEGKNLLTQAKMGRNLWH